MRDRGERAPGDEPGARRARAALRSFGGVEQIKEECRDALGRALPRDARSRTSATALRSLRRNPGFALVVGAHAGARHRRQHRDLQRRQRRAAAPAALRAQASASSCCASSDRRSPASRTLGFSVPEIADYRRAQPRRSTASSSTTRMCVHPARPARSPSASRPASSRRTSSTCWACSRCSAAPSGPATTQPGAEPVLVLSYEYWQRSHGGDPGVVGRHVRDERPRPHRRRRAAAGAAVSRRERRLHADLGLPVPLRPRSASRTGSARMVTAFGRLSPGRPLEQAPRRPRGVAARFAQRVPRRLSAGVGLRSHALAPLREELMRAGAADAADPARHGRRSCC